MTTLVERRAFAKINLDLRVTAVRGDGYHELATVFQTISLWDVVRVEQIGDDEPFLLDCDDPAIPSDDRNLVWKAAQFLWTESGRQGAPRGARITLQKRIPAQAGLGGGSADAAVALVALGRLWGVALDSAALRGLAARLGADVPFFLSGGTASGRGRGDELDEWPDLPAFEVVIALPSFGVPTAEAYAWYDESGVKPVRAVARQADGGWSRWLRGCHNDLEAPVFGRYPLLGHIKARMAAAGAALTLMSGSGSAVFGLFSDASAAEEMGKQCVQDGLAVRLARTVPRAEYQRAAF